MTKNEYYTAFCEAPRPKEELNSTTHFLLPSVEIPLKFLTLRQNGFVNAYIDDAENGSFYANCLFLLFNPLSIDDGYRDFERYIRGLENYVTDYDCGRNMIMFVFKVKDKWVGNLGKFKKSKYSQFDKDYVKTFFTPTIRQKDKTVPNKFYQILTKDPEYRKRLEYYLSHIGGFKLNEVVIPEENELASPIDPAREVFRFKSKE